MRFFLSFCLFFTVSLNLLGQEICDNGVDDDGDGLIDLNDPDCECSPLIWNVPSLIPNHSFEDTICCPISVSSFECADSWMQASRGTSDYFNTCGYTGGSWIGFPDLPPPAGSGYAGFINGQPGGSAYYKEYLGACLNSPLLAGVDYRLSLFVSRSMGNMRLDLTIFGTTDCADLPWDSYACPIGVGSWMEVATEPIVFPTPYAEWVQVIIEFTPTVDILAIAIGGGCPPDAPPAPFLYNYYFVDELILANKDNWGIIKESGNICSNSLLLTAEISTPGGSWQWYNDGVALIGENSPTLDLMPYGVDGVYTAVYALNGACIAIDHTVESSVGNSPRDLEILNNDTIVCEGTTIPIIAVGAPGFTYQWSPSIGVSDTTILNPEITPTDTANYYVLTASHPDCPDTSVGIHIGMQYVPEVNLNSDTQVCYGTPVALESLVSPYRSDYSYFWSPATGLQYAYTANNAFIADSSVTYSLEVTSPIGCKDSARIDIEVYPPDFASAISDTGFCPPSGGVSLWATGGLHYQWLPDYGLDDALSAFPWANPATPTHYLVIVTSEVGCVDSQEVFVDVYPNAVVYIPDTVVIYSGEVYQLETRGNAHYFDWFPPSGISNTQVSNPEFSPDVRTRYFVEATTEHGCTVKDSIDILVKSTVLDMPNAFKPGSDANGIFKVEMRGIAQLHAFAVFNRWGNKVFETTDIQEGWDGTFNKVPQPFGVYVYQIEAVTDSGEHISKQGNVTLIR